MNASPSNNLGVKLLVAACITQLLSAWCIAEDIAQLNNEALTRWTMRNPQLPATTLNDVIFANGGFLTVGQFGTIAKSTNLVEWTLGKSGTFSNLNSVAYGSGQYVAVGSAGTALRSTNGTDWAACNPGVTIDLPAVAYGNGRFVCVGTNGTIVASADAVAWSPANSPVGESLSDVAFGNGTFVAVGEFGTVLTSSDGLSWSIQSPGTTAWLRNISYMGGKFIVILDPSTLLTSNNGTSWSQKTAVGPAPVFIGDSSFAAAAAGIGVLFCSPDGNLWYQADAALNYGLINAVAVGNGKYCGVGVDGRLVISYNGNSWGDAYAGIGQNSPLYAVTYGGGKFVAVGDVNTRLASVDGYSWSGEIGNELKILGSVAYGNGNFVALGSRTYVSSDGSTWTTNAFAGNAITFANGYFVASTGSGTATSTNGTNWTTRSLGYGVNLNGVTFGNGMFLASGDKLILSSPDGLNWVTNFVLGTGYFTDVAFGNGKFVAVGNNGVNQSMVLISSDLTNWTDVSPSEPFIPQSIAYGNQLFAVVGNGASGGAILTSADGNTWARRDPDSAGDLNGVCYGGGKFLAVGYPGTAVPPCGMVESVDGIHWSRSSPFRWQVQGLAGQGGKVVAATKNGKLLTKEGQNGFQPVNAGFTNDLNGICVGSNTYVAVGSAGLLITSTDATNWVQRNSRATSDLKSVAFGDGKFVAVGGTQFRLSTNGTSWSILSDGTSATYLAITYGKDRFVSVGGNGLGTASRARSSTNGVDWVQSTPPGHSLFSIAYGNGVFVAGGYYFSAAYLGAVAVSSDGIQWQGGVLPSTGSLDSSIRAVAFGAGQFVAFSYDGFVLTSTNGLSWDRKLRLTNRHTYAAAYLNSSFFFGGELGAIFQSDYLVDEVNPSLTVSKSGSGIILSWPYTPPGFLLEFSSNLGNSNGWQPVAVGEQKSLVVPAISGNGFYRLRHP